MILTLRESGKVRKRLHLDYEGIQPGLNLSDAAKPSEEEVDHHDAAKHVDHTTEALVIQSSLKAAPQSSNKPSKNATQKVQNIKKLKAIVDADKVLDSKNSSFDMDVIMSSDAEVVIEQPRQAP